MADPISAAVASEHKGNRVPMGTTATGWRNKSTSVAPAVLEGRKDAKEDPIGLTDGACVRRRGTAPRSDHPIVAKLTAGSTQQSQPIQANGKVLKPSHSRSGNFYAAEFDGRI